MTKREQLEELDTLVLGAMTKALAAGNTEELRDLNVAVTYLKNNQVLTPPAEKGSAHDAIKEAIR